MGIQTGNRGGARDNSTLIRFSAFLGGLYVSTPASEAAIKQVKLDVGGEDEVKKGFMGSSGDSASAKAIAALRDKITMGVRVDGEIYNAYIHESNGADGGDSRKYKYIVAQLRDGDDRFRVSMALESDAGQGLIRKLVNVEPGERITINAFSTYQESTSQKGRFFSNQRASIKDAAGAEVPGVDPSAELNPLLETAVAKLKDAGVDDKETVNKRRSVVTNEWHNSLVGEIAAKFTAYHAANGKPQELGQDDPEFNGGDVPDDHPAENATPAAAQAAEPAAAEPAAPAPADGAEPAAGTVRNAAPRKRFR